MTDAEELDSLLDLAREIKHEVDRIAADETASIPKRRMLTSLLL